MTYLLIMVIVAAVGIARLWILQRRQRSRTNTIDGFQKALGAISKPDRASLQGEGAAVAGPSSSGRGRRSRVRELDPVRREAARRRIEARRASSRRGDARRALRRRAAG